MKKIKRLHPKISKKLQAVTRNLSVDVFGYEKKATQNILTYFEHKSQQLQQPKETIIIRVFNELKAIHGCIFIQGKLIQQISMKELISVFVSEETAQMSSMQQNVMRGIQTLITDIASASQIHRQHLHICITCSNAPQVNVYHQNKLLKKIAIAKLIKYFV